MSLRQAHLRDLPIDDLLEQLSFRLEGRQASGADVGEVPATSFCTGFGVCAASNQLIEVLLREGDLPQPDINHFGRLADFDGDLLLAIGRVLVELAAPLGQFALCFVQLTQRPQQAK